MTKKRALKDAIEQGGGLTGLGIICGVTPQAVKQWEQIPVRHVLKIEMALEIPRHCQRPDIYPPPQKDAA